MSYSCIYPNITLKQNILQPDLVYYIRSKYEQDWNPEPHQHPFTEIFYILDGKGTFFINGQPFSVKKNGLFIVNSLIPHCETSSETEPLSFIVLGVNNVNFSAPVRTEEHYEAELPGEGDHYFSDIDPNEQILGLLKNIEQELSRTEDPSGFVLNTYLCLLLVMINKKTNLACTQIGASQYSRHVAVAKKYIDTYFSEPITLELLAQKAFVSKYYLVHDFTKELGQSPIRYLLGVRINFAKIFLQSSNYAIKHISTLSGFNDYAYFSATFRKLTGISPKDYRKKYNVNK